MWSVIYLCRALSIMYIFIFCSQYIHLKTLLLKVPQLLYAMLFCCVCVYDIKPNTKNGGECINWLFLVAVCSSNKAKKHKINVQLFKRDCVSNEGSNGMGIYFNEKYILFFFLYYFHFIEWLDYWHNFFNICSQQSDNNICSHHHHHDRFTRLTKNSDSPTVHS